MRDLLDGWQWEYDTSRVRIGPLFLVAYPDGEYSISVDDVFGYGGDGVVSARIAAEDAARAMVADMAGVLGGSVTWGESEVSDG